MKTIKHIYLIIIALFCFSSCSDDFLAKAPISNMNEINFYQSENDFKLAVNGAYQTLYKIYAIEGPLAYTEQLSDNCTMDHIAGNTSEKFQFKNNNLLANNSMINDFWNSYYNALFTINTILKKLPDSSISDQLKLGYEAEMKFLRAIYYFDMVRLWGNVPLLTNPVTSDEAKTIARSSEADVYTQIIADLTFAESNLPVLSVVARVGQANKGAAQGMLGKVYLTKGDKNNAKIFLKKIIDSNEFTLLSDYSQLWDLKHENSKEALFEIQYIRGLTSPASRYWQAWSPFENTMNMGGGMNQVTDNLWNEYEATDVRRGLSIYDGYTGSGGFIAAKFPKKWTDTQSIISGSTRYSENNFIVLRYSDILLMYSEASQDASYLNQIRKRAGLSEWGTSGYPIDKYSTLELAIEHERRVELALEFQRWFDLKRTNRVIPVLASAKGKTIEQWRIIEPIPQIFVDQNPSIITQNQGY